MRTTWILKLCVPLASAAVLAGCTQEVGDGDTQNRTAIDNATNQQRQNLQISVTGCLGAGTGTNQYVLTHVRPAPLAMQPTDALSSANLTIPDNSAIRLASSDTEQLTRLVGQNVTVTGLLTTDGRNTIGTAGRAPVGPNEPEPRTDRSQAATDQHHSDKVRQEAGPIGMQSMNNGTYPEMTVQQVNGTGQKCDTSPVEERR
jgi:hypothetical protein